MEQKNKLIVWASFKTGRVLGAFGTVEEASKASHIPAHQIKQNLNGYITNTEWGYKFFYEETAGELRQAAQRKRREKEKEKLEKEGWFK